MDDYHVDQVEAWGSPVFGSANKRSMMMPTRPKPLVPTLEAPNPRKSRKVLRQKTGHEMIASSLIPQNPAQERKSCESRTRFWNAACQNRVAGGVSGTKLRFDS